MFRNSGVSRHLSPLYWYSPRMASTTRLSSAPPSYAAHVDTLLSRYNEAMHHCGYKAILLAAGEQLPMFLDDQHYPHRPNPHFLQWLPLFDTPDAWIICLKGQRPRIVILSPANFWHAAPELPDDSYLQHFDVEVHTDARLVDAVLSKLPRKTAIIDPVDSSKHANQQKLLNFLHFHRSIKTDYEIDCIRSATDIAVPAHKAAEEVFLEGGSGFDIHLAFLKAAGCSEHELPYPDIIACNENAATLHYERRTHEIKPASLLIDAGTAMNGYASDITRTYSKNEDFAALITSVDALQLELCRNVRPGISFGDAQNDAHLGIARILKEHQLVDMAPEAMIEQSITPIFFPHGLGHMLGLQVHDMGGHMADITGKRATPPKGHPKLRMSRMLEAGMVLTIEPGLYFIPTLLEELRTKPSSNRVNWTLVEAFSKFGGIRIEDNLVITESGAENITRNAFSDCPPI